MARSVSARRIRVGYCSVASNTLMSREMVLGVSVVWTVLKTRWPVSAAFSAMSIVSRSRISPTMITSGSWRRAARSALAKLSVSAPTSRWITEDFASRKRNSIGSSIVTIFRGLLWLMWLIIAASVEDLPLPVIPVSSTSPRSSMAISFKTGGSPSFSKSGILKGIARSTSASEPRWLQMLTRNRLISPKA